MNFLFELINSNTATFYLVVYVVLLLVAGISFFIYRTCTKKKVEEEEERSTFVSPIEHRRMSKDITAAESFGNEPLSQHDFHTVIKNGSISRKHKNVCLVCSLSKEDGNTL